MREAHADESRQAHHEEEVVATERKPGDVWFEEDPARPGWPKLMIQRASKVKPVGMSPVEQVAVYRALGKTPAVRKYLAEQKSTARKGSGPAPSSNVTTEAGTDRVTGEPATVYTPPEDVVA